jgi:hypothetical protein
MIACLLGQQEDIVKLFGIVTEILNDSSCGHQQQTKGFAKDILFVAISRRRMSSINHINIINDAIIARLFGGGYRICPSG